MILKIVFSFIATFIATITAIFFHKLTILIISLRTGANNKFKRILKKKIIFKYTYKNIYPFPNIKKINIFKKSKAKQNIIVCITNWLGLS